jgi:hypothetical protein
VLEVVINFVRIYVYVYVTNIIFRQIDNPHLFNFKFLTVIVSYLDYLSNCLYFIQRHVTS